YREEFATFGEDDVYSQADAGGFIRLFGLPQRIRHLATKSSPQLSPPLRRWAEKLKSAGASSGSGSKPTPVIAAPPSSSAGAGSNK
ncbi:MAG TPA: hypothetical protein VJB88_11515, partial [Vicinamibacteria bacterium]|nr:hypothetical protein [Vicinamibacteria bacterium]